MSRTEHPTPECENCASTQTRPLDQTTAVCFECSHKWRYSEDYSEYWEARP